MIFVLFFLLLFTILVNGFLYLKVPYVNWLHLKYKDIFSFTCGITDSMLQAPGAKYWPSARGLTVGVEGSVYWQRP